MKNFSRFIDSFGMGFIFLLLCLFFWFQVDWYGETSIFLTRQNFSNVLLQSSVNIIVATGMTFVICAAEIDLSVGSLLAFCGMIAAMLLKIDPETGLNLPMQVAATIQSWLPSFLHCSAIWWIASAGAFLILALAPGIIGGGVSGLIVARFGVPSFIVTLGFMMIYRGLARYLTNAAPITGMPPQFMIVGTSTWFSIAGFEIPYSAAIALIVTLVGIVILGYTRPGRHILSVGGNQQASFLTGVPVRKTRFLVFVISGCCAAIAAIILTSRMFIGDPNAGEGYELDAIAAVIIGGTSLFGGKGSVLGTLFGALIIGVLRNGLDHMMVTDHLKQIIIGTMIIFAVLLDYYRRKLYRAS